MKPWKPSLAGMHSSLGNIAITLEKKCDFRIKREQW